MAGNLAEKQISNRTFVVTEPEGIAECAKEFEDME